MKEGNRMDYFKDPSMFSLSELIHGRQRKDNEKHYVQIKMFKFF